MNCDKKRVLLAGCDLELKEPRGIAFYAKSVIKATYQLDYQNYLLTSAEYNQLKVFQQLNITRKLEGAEIVSGVNRIFRNKVSKKALIAIKYILRLGHIKQGNLIDRDSEMTLGIERLEYLESIAGYLNKEDIYENIGIHSKLFKSPYRLTLPKGEIDTVFCVAPMNISVERGTKLVQTLHDTIPLSTILTPPDDRPDLYYNRLKSMLINSDLVLSVSDFSRKELLTIFPDYDHKVITTHQPVPIYQGENLVANQPEVQASVLSKYNLIDQQYLLFIGSIEKRKNVLKIIEAHLASYEQINIPLVIIGSLGYGSSDISHYLTGSDYARSIKYFSYVPTIDKLVLLKKARAFIFPSFNEGFGLPPVEAMQMGCPVLTSNTSALPEICGDAALYVDPGSLSDIAKGIVEVATNEELRQKLIAKGFENVKRFSFEAYQNKLETVLSDLHK